MFQLKKVSSLADSELKIENVTILLNYENADEFWILNIKDSLYGFNLNSKTMVDPCTIAFPKKNVVFINIENKLIAFSTMTGGIRFFSGLPDLLIEVVEANLGYLVVTETTLMKINDYDFSIGRLISIPDVLDTYKVSKNKIIVTGISGEVFEFPFI